MKTRFEKGLKFLTVILISAVLGFVTLFLSYTIPISRIKQNVEKALPTFEKEEDYYMPFHRKSGSQLDNYTDALYLNMAITRTAGKNAITNALGAYSQDYKDSTPVKNLIETYKNTPNYYYRKDTARFWNGYMTFLNVFLLLFSYSDIRQFNCILQIAIMFLLIYLLIKRNLGHIVVPLFISYICLNPFSMGLNIFFSCLFVSSFIPCVILLAFHEKIKARFGYIYFFELVGITACYLNMNSSYLMTLCFPLVLYYVLEPHKTIKDSFFTGVKLCVSWGLGFLLFFLAKWVLGEIFTDDGTISFAYNAIKGRTSVVVNDKPISRLFTIGINGFTMIQNFGFDILLLIFTIFSIIVLKKNGFEFKSAKVKILTFFVIITLPFLWYLATPNHAYIHSWFTFRTLSVSVWGFCVLLSVLVHDSKSLTDLNNHAKTDSPRI